MLGVSARAFRRGAVAGAPMLVGIAPFGLMFGALAVQAGMDVAQAMAMTVIVVAGASQLAAVQLMADHAPAWLAILAGAVVNLRMALDSAVMARDWAGAPLGARAGAAFFLHDATFALAVREHAARPDDPWPERLGFAFGVGFVTVTGWLAGSYAGAVAGAQAPAWLGLEAAAPLMFLAIVAPLLRGAAHLAAAVTAAGAAAALAFLPLGLGLIPAALTGVAAGAGVEALLARRAAP